MIPSTLCLNLSAKFLVLITPGISILSLVLFFRILEEIEEVVKGVPERVTFWRNQTSLSQAAGECDLAISSGGQSLYELIFQGMGVVAVSLAENQTRQVAEFDRLGLVIGLQKESMKLGEVLDKLLQEEKKVHEMIERQQSSFDGRGTERIAREILSLLGDKMSKLAVIPARGGSKRIPGKNVKTFIDRPIIQYSIDAALDSKLFDEVMVSTDCPNIADLSKELGAKVPFIRSKENSDDFSSSLDVLKEVLFSYRREGKEFQSFCCLYPTAPFCNGEEITRLF